MKKLKIKIGRIFPGLVELKRRVEAAGKPKIFCIGRNKTGTTTLKQVFLDHGFVVGNQRKAELLLYHYAKRDFKPIIKYCRTATVFQDVPFSQPFTFQALDQAFPGSKFILSVRDHEDQWYRSVINFHSTKFGKNGRVPLKEDLQNAVFQYKGYMYDAYKVYKKTPEDDIYNEEMMKAHYRTHNEMVMDYFRHRKDDLLVINVSEKGDYKRLCDFIGMEPAYDDFPWKKKTSDMEVRYKDT